VLAFAIAVLGAGCSGESGGAEESQEAARQVAVPDGPTPTLSSPQVITSADLVKRLEGEDVPVILDVRSPEEYAGGHIPGAINVPYDQIAANLDSLESFLAAEIVVYCRTGRRAGVAEKALREAGFTQVVDLEGHMTSWNEAGLPVVVPAECC
jgi:rhodanese-related sulfurtransferase